MGPRSRANDAALGGCLSSTIGPRALLRLHIRVVQQICVNMSMGQRLDIPRSQKLASAGGLRVCKLTDPDTFGSCYHRCRLKPRFRRLTRPHSRLAGFEKTSRSHSVTLQILRSGSLRNPMGQTCIAQPPNVRSHSCRSDSGFSSGAHVRRAQATAHKARQVLGISLPVRDRSRIPHEVRTSGPHLALRTPFPS